MTIIMTNEQLNELMKTISYKKYYGPTPQQMSQQIPKYKQLKNVYGNWVLADEYLREVVEDVLPRPPRPIEEWL